VILLAFGTSGCDCIAAYGLAAANDAGAPGGDTRVWVDSDAATLDQQGSTEAGSTEAGSTEAGSTEAGSTEAGSTEAGITEAGAADAQSPDATAWVTPLGMVTTFAGTGVAGAQDGPVAMATFDWPWNLDVDVSGRVYVADYKNNKIRVIEGGVVSTLAGTGDFGFLNGPVAEAKFAYPHDVAVGVDGAVYVTDSQNQRIRMIDKGVVSTLAGDGTRSFKDGPAASAQFDTPYGLAVDNAGRVFVMEEGARIRLIENGVVSTFAGDGTIGFKDGPASSAQFGEQGFLAVDEMGRLFVGDVENNRIRLIENGWVSTYAGVGIQGYLDDRKRLGEHLCGRGHPGLSRRSGHSGGFLLALWRGPRSCWAPLCRRPQQ